VKVLLVNPPTANQFTLEMDEFVVKERGFYPPLGILSLATYLNRKTEHRAELIDCVAEEIGHEALLARVAVSRPDVVGISSTTFTLIDTLKAAEGVKRLLPKIHICVGGPHTRIYPRETIVREHVDSVVIGEGEFALAELCERLSRGASPEGMPGVLYKGPDGAILGDDTLLHIKDLDALPFPDRSLIRNELYWSVIGETRPSTTLMTSRGCPYRCTYCLHDRTYRCRSVPHVIDEIRNCLDLGIREILFFDESFAANRAHAKRLCEAIVAEKLRFIWHVRIRLNNIDDELIEGLRRAGCRRLQLGIESGSQEILDRVSKDINLADIDPVFRKMKRAGFALFVDFMIGLPGEREEQVRSSIDLAKRLPADFAQFSIFIPLPHTEIYEEGLRNGTICNDYWQAFARNPVSGFVPPFWHEYFTTPQLLHWYRTAIREFYFRPRYILRRALKIRSFRELLHYARLAVRLCLHTFSRKCSGRRKAP